jgi:hypothetical protein
MSQATTATRLNMLPATLELCHMEQPRLNRTFAFTTLMPNDYDYLKIRLEAILQGFVPEQYREALVAPFYEKLCAINGQEWFTNQLEQRGRPIEKVVHAIVQNFGIRTAEDNPVRSTEALREVIGDLHQKFLNTPCLRNPSPVLHWYQHDYSTVSPPETLQQLGVGVTIAHIPECYARKGAVAWGALGHEVTGHDILRAYPGALEQLKSEMEDVLKKNNLTDTVPYWSSLIEESAADVLGVLNMGPTAAFSLVASLRVMNKDALKLSNKIYTKDRGPIDLLRGYLVAYTVEGMSAGRPFKHASSYAQLILQEVEKDAENITELKMNTFEIEIEQGVVLLREFSQAHGFQSLLISNDPRTQIGQILDMSGYRQQFLDYLIYKCSHKIKESATQTNSSNNIWSFYHGRSLKDFKNSARLVAHTIISTRLAALNQHSFSGMRCWSERDEKISRVFIHLLTVENERDLVTIYLKGSSAIHVVSAAVTVSIIEPKREPITTAKLQTIFKRMITILEALHQANPTWQQPSQHMVESSSDDD